MRNHMKHHHPQPDDGGPVRRHHGFRFRPEWPDDGLEAPRGHRGHRRPGPMGPTPDEDSESGPHGMGAMHGIGPHHVFAQTDLVR